MVIDVLSRLLSKGISDNKISGVKLSLYCLILSHLFFADDAILFLKADVGECNQILGIINSYNEASGQLVNFDKSGVCFSSSVSTQTQEALCRCISMNQVSRDVKYLGLAAFWGRSKAEAYNFLLEKALV